MVTTLPDRPDDPCVMPTVTLVGMVIVVNLRFPA